MSVTFLTQQLLNFLASVIRHPVSTCERSRESPRKQRLVKPQALKVLTRFS